MTLRLLKVPFCLTSFIFIKNVKNHCTLIDSSLSPTYPGREQRARPPKWGHVPVIYPSQLGGPIHRLEGPLYILSIHSSSTLPLVSLTLFSRHSIMSIVSTTGPCYLFGMSTVRTILLYTYIFILTTPFPSLH